MTNTLKTFLFYLWGKRSELAQMDEKDALLAKLVMDIHRKRTSSSLFMVDLFALYPVHPIDRDNAMAATQKRIVALEQNKEHILRQKELSSEVLMRYIPSVSAIKCVRTIEGELVTFEGNGRLYALQHVFEKSDGLKVAVEEYFFRNTKKLSRRINRIRMLHGFLEAE